MFLIHSFYSKGVNNNNMPENNKQRKPDLKEIESYNYKKPDG